MKRLEQSGIKGQTSKVKKELRRVYETLLAHYGVQRWWPHESKWEILVGAILTQNTSWNNVEKALANLKRADILTPARLHALEIETLTELIRPAGFVTTKPKRLKTLAEFLLREYAGQGENLRGGDLALQRAQLLALNGIGPETADAILLYAAEQPIFVVDAYTRRIISRLGLTHPTLGKLSSNISYDDLQSLFMDNLPPDVTLFNEFHALLDVHAKSLCTKRAPRCGACPLNRICEKRLETE